VARDCQGATTDAVLPKLVHRKGLAEQSNARAFQQNSATELVVAWRVLWGDDAQINEIYPTYLQMVICKGGHLSPRALYLALASDCGSSGPVTITAPYRETPQFLEAGQLGQISGNLPGLAAAGQFDAQRHTRCRVGASIDRIFNAPDLC
jgi:hypothetical protein